jgi:hypothetical protein
VACFIALILVPAWRLAFSTPEHEGHEDTKNMKGSSRADGSEWLGNFNGNSSRGFRG